MLFSSKDPGCTDCCIPKKYRDPDSYDKKMDQLDNQLMLETEKPA